MLRYNSSLTAVEIFMSSAWNSLAALGSNNIFTGTNSLNGQASFNGVNPYIAPTKRLPQATDDWTKGYFGDGAIDSLFLTNSVTGCSGTPTLTIAAPATGV
jgi:hypothetical protein